MRPAVVLTDAVAARAAPRRAEYTLRDARCPGFGLRVRTCGARSWVLRVKVDGARKRIVIGAADAMSAEEARARAFALLAGEAGASRPTALAKAPPPAQRFSLVAEAFLAEKVDAWRPSTLASARKYLRSQLLPAFGATPINRLTTPQVAEWFHGYSRTRPGGANTALTHLRMILNWARETDRLATNAIDPTKPIRRNRMRARGSLLSAAQIDSLGRALNAAPPSDRDAADAVRLILLTGCRSGEILRLAWVDVRTDRLRLREAKTGPREVLLSEAARKLLRARRRVIDGPMVFPSPTDPAAPRANIDGAWRRLRAQAELPPTIRLHDLRHTYASQALMQGETLAMAGRLLGHARTASTERYAHLEGGYLMDAADRCAARVAALLG